MLKKFYLSLIAFFALGLGSVLAQAGIKVTVTDKKTGEAIPFATVVVFNGGIQVGVQNTDFDGVAIIKPINPGKYDVKVNFIGYQPKELQGVVVGEGKVPAVGIALSNDDGIKLDEVKVEAYVVPLVDPDTKSGGTVTREQYQNMATKNVLSVASTTAGVYQADEGKAVNVRGSRSSSTQVFIDGERVIGGSGVAQGSVDQVSVVLGGLPAQYGDATGGVISITTRGPQSKFFGNLEGISSQLTDAFGYNFLGFSVGGPIISKKDTATGAKKAILGFIISGQGTIEKDADPSAVGIYKVKDDKLADIEQNPLRPSVTGTGVNRNAEFLSQDDLQHYKARQNVTQRAILGNAKLDFKPNNNLNVTLSGMIDYNNGHDFINTYALLNPVNNSQTINNTWRVSGRLTQKFGSASNSKDSKSSATVKNAFLTMQIGYTRTKTIVQDDTHKDKFFDYGYIGKFTQTKAPTYTYTTRNINDGSGNFVPVSGYFQDGFSDVSLAYERAEINPLGANYTDQVYGFLDNRVTNLFDIQQNLGLMNGDRPLDIYNMYAATGRQYGGYNISENAQFRFTSSFSADIKNHAVQIGVEFDRRDARAYGVSPISLWTRMRQLANIHTTELDTTNAIYNQALSGSFPYYDYERKYNASQQTYFSKELLKALGLPENYNGWVDVDAIDPSTFSMNMFSAEDMMLGGAAPLVAYNGYDHRGERVKRQSSFDDYFTGKDEAGYRTYAQGAFKPIYMAGYIQDKFDFKDLKFNIGLRVDRYDANQSVLKDRYLFKEAKTVSEVNNLGSHPSNVASDATVYVDDIQNPTKIVGYRSGNVWYNSSGTEISDPLVLAQATSNGTIAPYLVDPNGTTMSMEQGAFKDYKPQINVMPRVAFSFPISDVANFFAHYDLLTQRPTVAQRLDLTDYEFIFNNTGAPLNNPDLKAEKTTDYELGFTQILNEKKNSALKITSFYREMRDMISIVRVAQAFPKTYMTYQNLDFGTVKGFSFEYDLRRTGGISVNANYTLQFADGSGSNANGGYNLANSGQPNLRVTLPLDFDQRHTFTTTFDYRFGEGEDYKGPLLNNKKKNKKMQILKNVGGNIVLRAGSGTPYTRQSFASAEAIGSGSQGSIVGQVNGSYKPWQFRADLRIDKNIELELGKKKSEDKRKQANLNIYVQVLNLFNTKNIVNVYSYTGNPNDDGYLASPFSQANIAAQVSPQAFSTLYSVKVNNPANYSIPRRIRIGCQLNF